MQAAKWLLQRLSWLSIDVVFGAMAGMYFFSRLLDVPLFSPDYILLGLAVGCIYNVDHLLDSRNPNALISPRRKFHQENSTRIGTGIALLSILGGLGGLGWFGWGKELLWIGLIISMIGVVRFLIWNFGKGWMKELSIAIFYVIGISWLPFLRAGSESPGWEFYILLVFYATLAFINLLMLSHLDAAEDTQAGFFSAAQDMIKPQLIRWIKTLVLGMLLALGISLLLMDLITRQAGLIVGLMTLVHAGTFARNTSPEQKRLQMEWIFSLPWLWLLV